MGKRLFFCDKFRILNDYLTPKYGILQVANSMFVGNDASDEDVYEAEDTGRKKINTADMA